MRRFTVLAGVMALAAGSLTFGLTGGAGAGVVFEGAPTLRVAKVVEGPQGATDFTVLVSCVKENPGTSEWALIFGPDGTPKSANPDEWSVQDRGFELTDGARLGGATCTVAEQTPYGGASSWTHTCTYVPREDAGSPEVGSLDELGCQGTGGPLGPVVTADQSIVTFRDCFGPESLSDEPGALNKTVTCGGEVATVVVTNTFDEAAPAAVVAPPSFTG